MRAVATTKRHPATGLRHDWPQLATEGKGAAVPAVSDHDAMQAALQQARLAELHGDVPIGAVVVRGGEIIAARHNERELTGDPTAHADRKSVV